MRDDAIAPVIAVMLILAAIVTFYSIWNAIYVPAVKESAEVDHLHNVETSFVHFSSDLYFAASSRQDHLSFSEPVQLGGGDTLVNELKSSGALQVAPEDNPVYNLTFFNESGTPIYTNNGTLVSFSYEPVSNFWQDQGYTWQYGYLNVTKNSGTLSTPLNYLTMADVENDTNTSGTPLNEFASSLGSVGYTPYTNSYSSNLPVVTSISPKFVVPNTTSNTTFINIWGSGFSQVSAVYLDGIPVNNYTIENDGLIYAYVNNQSAINGDVDFINGYVTFTVNVTVSAPAGNSISSPSDVLVYNSSTNPALLPSYSPSWTGYCSAISLAAVNINASSMNFISSNGYGTLTLTTNSTQVPLPSPVTSIVIGSDGSPFGNAALASWNKELSDLANDPCSNSITNVTQQGWQNYTYTLQNQAGYPTNVNLTVMQVTVGAH